MNGYEEYERQQRLDVSAYMKGLAKRRQRGAITCVECGKRVNNVLLTKRYCGVNCRKRAQRARDKAELLALRAKVAEQLLSSPPAPRPPLDI